MSAGKYVLIVETPIGNYFGVPREYTNKQLVQKLNELEVALKPGNGFRLEADNGFVVIPASVMGASIVRLGKER